MEFKTLLVIFIVIVLLDKGLTILNILEVNKHFPEATAGDYYKVEQNPVAKWFFEKMGLWLGSLVYGIISVISLFVTYYLICWTLMAIGIYDDTAERIALWFIFICYGIIIANNTYFALKYSTIIS